MTTAATSLGVRGIKLVTGDEIFGHTEIMQDGRFIIKKPVAIRMMPSKIQGGEPSMAFVPFPTMASENFTEMMIEPLHIVYQFVAYPDLVTEYQALLSGNNSGTKQIITG